MIRSPIKLPNGKTLEVEAANGKCLFIDTSSVAFINVEKNEEDYISSVSLEDNYVIKMGDKVEVNLGTVKSVYEVKLIAVESNDKSVLLFSSIPTKTSRFLLPMFNKTKIQLRYDSYFINAFVDDDSKHMSLMYRFTGTELYKKFEEVMMKNSLFVKHIDYDPYHVMYVFRVPEEFEVDVEAFKEGKYSLFSKTLRQRILKFYGNEDQAGTMKVIRQDEGLRKAMEKELKIELSVDAELASKPNLETEIYNI